VRACLILFSLSQARARLGDHLSLSHVMCFVFGVKCLVVCKRWNAHQALLVCTCLVHGWLSGKASIGLWGTWLRDFCAFLANVASPRAYLGVILKIKHIREKRSVRNLPTENQAEFFLESEKRERENESESTLYFSWICAVSNITPK